MITEDLDVFLNDFGVSVSVGSTTGIGVLDSPDDLLGGGLSVSTEYRLTVKASVFGSLKSGDSITVNSINYTVRHFRLNDDGQFGTATLSKV